MNDNHAWTERQTKSEESRRAYERERLVVWALDDVAEAMQKKGLTKADMARALGTSRAHITQVLSGARNITLGTLADFAWACGVRAEMRLQPLRNNDFVASPVLLVASVKPRVVCTLQKSGTDSYSMEPDLEMLAGCN